MTDSLLPSSSDDTRVRYRIELQRYRAMVEHLNIALSVFQPDGTLVYCNPRALDIFGSELETAPNVLEPRPGWRYINSRGGGDVDWSREHPFFRVRAGEDNVRNEIFGIVPPDERDTRWMLTEAHAIYDEDGALALIAVTISDVTERERDRETLQSTLQRLESAERIARLGHWRFEIDTGDCEFSAGVLHLLRLRPHDVPTSARDLANLVHVDDRAVIDDAVRTSVRNATSFDMEIRLVRGHNHFVRCQVIGQPEYNGAGQLSGFFGTCMDLTERIEAESMQRRFEAEAQQAARLKSLEVLAGGIAHDFNNLLMGMQGAADLVAVQIPPDSPAQHTLSLIEKTAVRAAELTKQLLAFAGRGQVSMESVDFNELVSDMQPLLESFTKQRVPLHIDLAQQLPTFDSDPTQLRQVLINLLINAIDASPDGRPVFIRTFPTRATRNTLRDAFADSAQPGFFVCLEVIDHGVGMDTNTLNNIFDPFFTTKPEGHGLGLAAVQGIVRSQRGFIKVTSEPNEGTTFCVGFPVVTGIAQPKFKSQLMPTLWTPGGTAFLAEDQATVREVTSAMLEDKGFEVITAVDGKDALVIIETLPNAPTVAVLDMHMPFHTGAEVFQALRQRFGTVPVLFVSGYDHELNTRELLREDAVAFLNKPFGSQQLGRRLNALLNPI